MSWKDRTFEHPGEEALSFPFIQWVNNGGSVEPRAERGGFACPTGQEVSIPGIDARLHHRNGEYTEVIFAQELSAAVFKTRFAWIKDGVRIANYTRGARGKLQVLVYVRGENGTAAVGPVMLTFTGIPSRQFGQLRKQFAAAVRKATKGKAPAYAFWMRLKAGEVEMVGQSQKSPITTIELAADLDPDRDYIGDALVDSIPWPQAEEWAKAWDSPGPNGEGEIAGAESEESSDDRGMTLEQARSIALPVNATKSGISAGTPLGQVADKLPDTKALLNWLSAQSEEHPHAAQAATLLVNESSNVDI